MLLSIFVLGHHIDHHYYSYLHIPIQVVTTRLQRIRHMMFLMEYHLPLFEIIGIKRFINGSFDDFFGIMYDEIECNDRNDSGNLARIR